MERIESGSAEQNTSIYHVREEGDLSQTITSIQYHLKEGNFQKVVDGIRMILNNSPIGEIHSDAKKGFFSILGELFIKNREYFLQIVPLLENHQIQFISYQPHYLSIFFPGYIAKDPQLDVCLKVHPPLDQYDDETALDLISTFDDERIKISAYLTVASNAAKKTNTFPEEAFNSALEAWYTVREDDLTHHFDYGKDIVLFALSTLSKDIAYRLISVMETTLQELREEHGEIPQVLDLEKKLDNIKEAVSSYENNPNQTLDLNIHHTQYAIITNQQNGNQIIRFYVSRHE